MRAVFFSPFDQHFSVLKCIAYPKDLPYRREGERNACIHPRRYPDLSWRTAEFPSRWGLVYLLAINKYGNKQLFDVIIPQRHPLPGFHLVENREGLGFVNLLLCQGNQVRQCLAGFIVKNAKHLFIARVRRFPGVFADFNLRLPYAVNLPGCQLLSAAQRRTILAGNQLCAYTPGVNFSALLLQLANNLLVQIAGGTDDGVGIPCCIQHFPRLLA